MCISLNLAASLSLLSSWKHLKQDYVGIPSSMIDCCTVFSCLLRCSTAVGCGCNRCGCNLRKSVRVTEKVVFDRNVTNYIRAAAIDRQGLNVGITVGCKWYWYGLDATVSLFTSPVARIHSLIGRGDSVCVLGRSGERKCLLLSKLPWRLYTLSQLSRQQAMEGSQGDLAGMAVFMTTDTQIHHKHM